MNWTGRISFAATFGFLSHLFCVQAHINTFTPGAILKYGNPVEIKYWDSKRKPLDQMVDITNELGIKVLAEHDYLNLNNIAFSPYGLMGILVALYEGVDGEASYQIKHCLQLPWDRTIIRIGFRDIHRALKTYFVPEEGFLAGLALNNENVVFTEHYKCMLRFYGFDLQETETTTIAINATSNESTTTSAPTKTDGTSDITIMQSTTTKEETTMPQTSLTTNTISATDAETPANVEADTEANTTQTPSASTTQSTIAETTTATVTESSTTHSETTQTIESTNLQPTTIITTAAPTTQTDLTSTTSRELLTTPFTTETTSSPTTTATSQDKTTSTQSATESESDQTSTDSTTSVTESTVETLQRKKKSIIDFLLPDMDYSVEYRSFKVGQEKTEDDINDESKFMVNGLRKIEVPYMHYEAVLDYAYLPHLEASALRLPLDSDRYYLLIVLPNRAGPREISRLLARMARESDLSDVYGALRPRRVRAMVPSFVVKGHVILTTDLQKLGMRDVFEPRQRDFTPMTNQPGVYVRSIEQAVSVSIRKYQPDDSSKHASKQRRTNFSATYPFLYFVMDSSINVSLMAGKLVDPLNSRIL